MRHSWKYLTTKRVLASQGQDPRLFLGWTRVRYTGDVKICRSVQGSLAQLEAVIRSVRLTVGGAKEVLRCPGSCPWLASTFFLTKHRQDGRYGYPWCCWHSANTGSHSTSLIPPSRDRLNPRAASRIRSRKPGLPLPTGQPLQAFRRQLRKGPTSPAPRAFALSTQKKRRRPTRFWATAMLFLRVSSVRRYPRGR